MQKKNSCIELHKFIIIKFFISFKLMFKIIKKIYHKCMFLVLQITFKLVKFHLIKYN